MHDAIKMVAVVALYLFIFFPSLTCIQFSLYTNLLVYHSFSQCTLYLLCNNLFLNSPPYRALLGLALSVSTQFYLQWCVDQSPLLCTEHVILHIMPILNTLCSKPYITSGCRSLCNYTSCFCWLMVSTSLVLRVVHLSIVLFRGLFLYHTVNFSLKFSGCDGPKSWTQFQPTPHTHYKNTQNKLLGTQAHTVYKENPNLYYSPSNTKETLTKLGEIHRVLSKPITQSAVDTPQQHKGQIYRNNYQ